MRKRLSTSAFVMIALFMPLAGSQAVAQTPGEQMFQRRCGVCHSAKQGEIKTGPSLWGVVGRKAGTDPAFRYSSGLKESGLVWDEATLNAYVESPRRLIPKTNMSFMGERNAENRSSIVAYLAGLH